METDEPDADVALLAPVPKEHLLSGLTICAEQRAVAFGTDDGMTLSTFAYLIGEGGTADVLFYATHSTEAGAPSASYRARFERYVGGLANGKAPPSCAHLRPPTTATDGAWKSFYIVSDLRKLPVPVAIKSLHKHGTKGELNPSFKPHGPLIINTPF